MSDTIDYRGYNIKIEEEVDGFGDTRRDWDNVGTMVCWHDRYKLGDEHNYTDPEDFLEEHPADGGKTFIMPLYLYDHSGITMKSTPFGDRWDSGQVGFIYVDVADAKKEFPGVKDWKVLKSRVYKALEAEVKLYDMYLRGEVYFVEVTDANGQEIDGGGGIYGYDEAVKLAKLLVDDYEKRPLSERHKTTAPGAGSYHR